MQAGWAALAPALPDDRLATLQRWFAPMVACLAADVALEVEYGERPDRDWFWCRIAIADRRLRLTIPHPLVDGSPPSFIVICRLLGAMIVIASLADRVGARSCGFMLGLGDDALDADAGFCSAEPGCCLIADGDYLLDAGLHSLRQEIARAQPPWHERSPTIFWRGSTTGVARPAGSYDAQSNPFAILPRLDLCARLQAGPHRDQCDVGISKVVQITDPALVALVEERLLRPFVHPVDQLRHRYQIVMDGNSNTWARFPAALAMGACVLLVASPHGYRQWFYDRVVPWVHVVPVRADLSDLEERVAWVLAHDSEAEAIARRGHELGAELALDQAVAESVSRLEARFAREGHRPPPT